MPGRPLALAALLAAGCSFTPAGAGSGDDDGDGGGGDSGTGIDGDGPRDAPAAGGDAAADARPACPADYDLVLAATRYALRPAATIDAARSDCADDLSGRTRLASFEIADDLPVVMLALGATGPVWVGARCTFTPAGCDGAASWTWDSGAAIAGSLWADGEPDNPYSERVATASRDSDGDWRLASALPTFHAYVCACTP